MTRLVTTTAVRRLVTAGPYHTADADPETYAHHGSYNIADHIESHFGPNGCAHHPSLEGGARHRMQQLGVWGVLHPSGVRKME